jgi:hypothetical protein
MTIAPLTRLLPALALCLFASGCAWNKPAAPVVLAPVNQCVLAGPGAEGRLLVAVPYARQEDRCGAEAWCASAGFPQARDLIFAQAFARCMGPAVATSTTTVLPLGAAPGASTRVAPLAQPPRPYRN